MSLGRIKSFSQIRDLFEKGPLLGVASGSFLRRPVWSVRHASLSLESGDVLLRSGSTSSGDGVDTGRDFACVFGV